MSVIDLDKVRADVDSETAPVWQRRGVRTMRDVLEGVYRRCQQTEQAPSCSCCHPELDRILGGFRHRRIAVLGAVTSWGKSSYALMVADVALRAGKRVLFVSAEDDEVTCGKRIVARRSGINAMRLRDQQLTEYDHGRLTSVVASAEATPWFLDGVGKSAEALSAIAAEVCREQPYDLIIVDYLQAIRAQAQDRRNEVTTVARLFGDAIKRADAAGLLLSQIKRIEGRAPTMHDLKESGDVENMAEHILIGTTSEDIDDRTGKPATTRYLKVAKNKDGPGSDTSVRMRFDAATASFQETK